MPSCGSSFGLPYLNIYHYLVCHQLFVLYLPDILAPPQYHAGMTPPESPAHPRSLVPDLLGDLDRSGIGEIRLKHLVTLGEELGIPGPTMRVTLARLREREWFDVRREGRESVYIFTETCLTRLREGARWFHREPRPWGGEWAMVIYTVPESDRHTRDTLRKQLVWLGFGALAPATWLRPDPSLDDVNALAAGLPGARITPLTTRTEGLSADRALVEQCWDLAPLAADYERFVRGLRLRAAELERAAGDPLRAATARIRLVNAYRNFAKRDPRLPAELQPAGWRGDEARRLFVRFHTTLGEHAAERYHELLSQ
ncbi:hypothetical protein D1J51_13370 [Leucobacter sp. wl10]|nr:hypothetical protein D1J51_13370 [Leucobacter sp. wl10]